MRTMAGGEGYLYPTMFNFDRRVSHPIQRSPCQSTSATAGGQPPFAMFATQSQQRANHPACPSWCVILTVTA